MQKEFHDPEGGIAMADQYNENGGLHFKNDYAQSESGYSPDTYDTGMGYGDPNQKMYQTGAYYEEPYQTAYTAGDRTASVSNIMTGSFMYMFIALLVTGIIAVVTASSPTLLSIIFSSQISLMMVFVLEFAVVIGASTAMKRNNVVLSGVLFFTYAIVNGLTLSVIFLAYTATSIEHAFFSTAVVFGIMALVGKFTTRDLTSIGNILMVGLFAVIIVSLVNLLIGSDMVDMVITVVTIVIFLGLTAYDTQKIKKLAVSGTGYSLAVISLWGAMELYLDFINLFLRILRLMGRRKG